MKRRVKQNVWGNWNGYQGNRKVVEFGTDDVAAGYWLQTGKVDHDAGYESLVMINLCLQAARRGHA